MKSLTSISVRFRITRKHEKMFPMYYFDISLINRFKYSITHWCVIRRERINLSTLTYLQLPSFPNSSFLVNRRRMLSKNVIIRIHLSYISSVYICYIYCLLSLSLSPSVSLHIPHTLTHK